MLEQLSHLTAWARSLVMVTGPFGAGKTTLLDRVVARVAQEQRVNVVRPPVGFLSNGHEFLRHVAADLGAKVPEHIDAPGLQQLVMQQVVAELAADRSCLLVLDDAHELSANVLRAVVELVDGARESRGLNVLIAGEPALPEQLAKAAAARENWHEIRLRPLPVNEARQFLKSWRPEALAVLDAAAFQALYRKAGGWPGRIVAQVDGELRQRRTRRFPLIHLLWLAAMAVALVIVLVLQQRAAVSPTVAAAAKAPVVAKPDDKIVDTLSLPPLPVAPDPDNSPAGIANGVVPNGVPSGVPSG